MPILVLALAGALGSDPRGDLERMEQALDRTVAQASQTSVVHTLGVGECHGYELKGYGAVFVLAPRLLPAPGRHVVIFGTGEGGDGIEKAFGAMQQVLKDQVQQQLRQAQEEAQKAQKDTQKDPRLKGRTKEAREIQAIQEQAEAFQREAQRAREEAERALESIRQQLQVREVSPGSPAAAQQSPAPSAPPPPWTFWFQGENTEDNRSPEAVIRDVASAVTTALETAGPGLASLEAAESVVVAADFFPPGGFGVRSRPARTLVVRARKGDLELRASGQISPEQLRSRIEYVVY
jgi:hypothetical protein